MYSSQISNPEKLQGEAETGTVEVRLERCDGPVLGCSLGKWKGIDF